MGKRKNPPYKPSAEELKGAPKGFFYEFSMFNLACNFPTIMRKDNKLPEEGIQNIALELALLHARNLLDFFCGSRTPNDDIRAYHFVDPQKMEWSSNKVKYLLDKKQDINKTLSHLTYARVEKKAKWNIQLIYKEIHEAYKEFLDNLPENEKENWILE